ncbi:hypothetical protein [Streptomyces sp. NPDC015350]
MPMPDPIFSTGLLDEGVAVPTEEFARGRVSWNRVLARAGRCGRPRSSP